MNIENPFKAIDPDLSYLRKNRSFSKTRLSTVRKSTKNFNTEKPDELVSKQLGFESKQYPEGYHGSPKS